MKPAILGLILLGALHAQQTVAPTTQEPVGPARGDNVAEYNIVNSIELGDRFDSVGGNLDSYKSQVNFGNGIRLLGSFFSINSRDGHGKYFDEIVLTTQGLGNDPYESAVLRVSKNRLYRYDMHWRLNDYYNPGLASAGQFGGNFRDTRYTAQDDDLTLFPDSKYKFFLGYSRGVQAGPEITNVGMFIAAVPTGAANSETAGLTSLRDARNEYRVGSEFQFFGVRLNWMHGWEDFKEDFFVPPGTDANGNAVAAYQTNPYHGTSPYWRVGLFTDKKWFSVNGRFTYSDDRRAFVAQQSGFLGGAPQLLQSTLMGTGHRPVATANLTVSVYLTPKLTFTNSTALYNVRTDGNLEFLQLNNVTGQFITQNFLFLGIRTVANQADLNYRARKWLEFYGGYHYSDRYMRNILDQSLPTFYQTSILNAEVAGIRLRPMEPLTIVLSGELGHANQPFTPKSDKDYHALGARVQYKKKSLLASAYANSNYNNNSVSFTAFSSHARTYAANLSWSPLKWLSFNTDYSKMHMDSLGGIMFFEGGENAVPGYSLYISNLQTGNLGARFALGKRADLYVGYSHVQDTGDGRSNPDGTGFGTDIPAFQAAQTFPMKFLSPVGRFSVKINNRVRWNVGYQYYGYHEDFFTGQDFTTDQAYRAQTGYTSLLFSF
jgi:hypothetical protein